MIHLKQPLVLSAQSSNVASPPLFATAAAASGQQRRASGAGRSGSGRRLTARRISCASTEEAVSTSVTTKERPLTVTAVVTAQAPTSVYVARGLDDIQDLFGKTLLLELVSSELDPSELLYLSRYDDGMQDRREHFAMHACYSG
jgi:lipoxygenase